MAVFKGIIPVGSMIEVKYSADTANTGSSLVLLGFVPYAGSNVPPEQADIIAPSGSAKLDAKPEEPAFMRIDVDVPTNSDGGTLEVFVDSTLHDRGVVGDTTWRYVIIEGE